MSEQSSSPTEQQGDVLTDFVAVIKRTEDDIGVVTDEERDKWITMTRDGDTLFPICVTMHENGIADGEIIPNPLFEEFCDEGVDFGAEPPEKVVAEVERLA